MPSLAVVFVMDCTYKNKFGLPLLSIVGMAATNQSFNAGYALIIEETQAQYVWALECFKYIVSVNPLTFTESLL
jgi:MULE transposase domain